jgi:hypothetical protein
MLDPSRNASPPAARQAAIYAYDRTKQALMLETDRPAPSL